MWKRTVFCAAGSALLALLAGTRAHAGVITPRLESALQSAGRADELPVIVTVAGKVDPASFGDRDRRLRRWRIVQALRDHAHLTQAPVSAALRAGGVRRLATLWIINGMAVVARPRVIRALARRSDIERVDLDAVVTVPQTTLGSASANEWNIDTVGAPALWTLGFTGAQRVVASMDTGVDVHHPDLGPSWRGGSNSWFDPNGQHAIPTDFDGHGTWTMGVLVGGAAGGTSIGVAPGAQWIAVKIFDDSGVGSLSNIHLGFQWLLDPDGDPVTDDAPDVVNNSWDLLGTVGRCASDFEADVRALEAAGIAVVFSAGNLGPGDATSVSPANYADGVAVGAVDASSTVARFSGRGPSACDDGLYPRLVAPGVNVRTADLTYGGVFPQSYAYVSGTSFAAPHVAGGLALLGNAFPDASVAELEAAIASTARDLAPLGPDQASGYGLLDLPAAYDWLRDRFPTTTSTTTTSTTITSTTTSSTSPSTSTSTVTSTSTSFSSTSSTTATSLPPPVPVTAVLADTYADAGKSKKNFASAPRLCLQSSPRKRIYIRVQVSNLGAAPFRRALLRLTVAGSKGADSVSGGRIQQINSCDWDATKLTFARQPPLDGSAGPDVGRVARGATVDFDVTSAVRAARDGIYCFAITTTSGNRGTYNSSEAATGRPQFIVQ
jgi:bacillopeptidase F